MNKCQYPSERNTFFPNHTCNECPCKKGCADKRERINKSEINQFLNLGKRIRHLKFLPNTYFKKLDNKIVNHFGNEIILEMLINDFQTEEWFAF